MSATPLTTYIVCALAEGSAWGKKEAAQMIYDDANSAHLAAKNKLLEFCSKNLMDRATDAGEVYLRLGEYGVIVDVPKRTVTYYKHTPWPGDAT